MISPDIRKPIQEFDVTPRNVTHRKILELLKAPTRLAADLHIKVGPRLWYGDVFKGDFNSPEDWEKFAREYRDRVSQDPSLRDRYSRITKGWHAAPIASVPQVNTILNDLSIMLFSGAARVESNARNRAYKAFAGYLKESASLLPEGKFDDAMVSFLKLPTNLRVGWMVLPVEYQDDPLGDRASFQGLLAYPDLRQTRIANKTTARYMAAAQDLYGEQPMSARVFVANVVISSGFLGVGERQISGFNVPNDQEVAERAGNTVIYSFPNGMNKKNTERLSPALKKVTGRESSLQDISDYTLAHEIAHGYRPAGEQERLGSMRAAVREAWASARAVHLSSSPRFSESLTERVVVGDLAFASDDIGRFYGQLFEPYGRNQPTVSELLRESPYAVGAYILLRQAFLEGAIRDPYGHVNVDKLRGLAADRDEIYAEMVKSGTEESAKKDFNRLIDRRTPFFLSVLRYSTFPNG